MKVNTAFLKFTLHEGQTQKCTWRLHCMLLYFLVTA